MSKHVDLVIGEKCLCMRNVCRGFFIFADADRDFVNVWNGCENQTHLYLRIFPVILTAATVGPGSIYFGRI
jgi:hypothetical protein